MAKKNPDATIFDRPARAATGEVFVMRHPNRVPGTLHEQDREVYDTYWSALEATIKQLGGEVREAPAIIGNKERDGMFVRDPGIVIPRKGRQPLYLRMDDPGEVLRQESEDIVAASHDLIETHDGPGRFEGGHVVYDRTRHILFWGMNNNHHLGAQYAEFDGLMGESYPPDTTVAQKEQRIAAAKPWAEGWQEAQRWLDAQYKAGELDARIRVVPMFIPDAQCKTFYHLDGCMNILPTGQAVVCEEVLSKTAVRALEKTIGRENIITVSKQDAQYGATNFITVGNTIITPHATLKMRHAYKQLGYDTVTPKDIGLSVEFDIADGKALIHNPWMFHDMAAVRCGTVKVTDDMGFPSPDQQQPLRSK